MIFDVNQQDLQHRARLVIGVYVVDFKEYTTY